MSYFKTTEHGLIEIHDIEKIAEELITVFKDQAEQNRRLREANAELKSETYAQDEVARMQAKYDEMKADYYRGFPISAKESAAIQEWQEQHTINKHNARTLEQKMKLEGVSGGRWEYRFVPTAIGTFGCCICPSCYAKAIQAYDDYLKLTRKRWDFDKRKEIMKEYDAELEFQEA